MLTELLTKQSDNQASYIALDGATPAKRRKSFDSAATVLANSYAKVVEATAQGKLLKPAQIARTSKNLTPEEEARRIAASTGYAMQLQFFGNQLKAQAPEIVNAWIADSDMEKLADHPDDAPLLAVEPAVLLTKRPTEQPLQAAYKLLLEGSENAFFFEWRY